MLYFFPQEAYQAKSFDWNKILMWIGSQLLTGNARRRIWKTEPAKYLPQQNKLLINGDFRVFNDMIDRWCKKYSHAPGSRHVIEEVVREWFEQQLVEAVLGAQALRGSTQWTVEEVERIWSEEALTSVVLPRYHIDNNVKRTLGAKLGTLKEKDRAAAG